MKYLHCIQIGYAVGEFLQHWDGDQMADSILEPVLKVGMGLFVGAQAAGGGVALCGATYLMGGLRSAFSGC